MAWNNTSRIKMQSSDYHSQVMARMDLGMDEIASSFKDFAITKKPLFVMNNAKNFILTKFVVGINSVQMTDICGDIEGVTGYTLEEFRGKDMIELLKVSKEQIAMMIHKVETEGVCSKQTVFTKKDGSQVNVLSQIFKLSENVYIETTVTFDSIIRL